MFNLLGVIQSNININGYEPGGVLIIILLIAGLAATVFLMVIIGKQKATMNEVSVGSSDYKEITSQI